jgi:hypothetical protein
MLLNIFQKFESDFLVASNLIFCFYHLISFSTTYLMVLSSNLFLDKIFDGTLDKERRPVTR